MKTAALLTVIAAMSICSIVHPSVSYAEKPEVSLRWMDKYSQNAVEATLTGGDDIIEPCLQNGLELRLKYEIKSCLRSKRWFDTCQEPILVTRSVDFDPIGERFRIRQDIRGDSEDPEEGTVQKQESAISIVRVAPKIPVSLSIRGKRAQYIRARVFGECRGSGARTLERLSSFLSLGLVSTPGFESEWSEFQVVEAENK